MNKNRKDKKRILLRILLASGICLLLGVLLTSALALWTYHKAGALKEKVLVEKALAVPEKVTLGENFSLKILYRLPWGTNELENAFLAPPENMIVSSPPYFRTEKRGWGYDLVEGVYPLLAFADGKSKGGAIVARFRNRDGKEIVLEEKIPEMTVLPLKTASSDLLTEGKILAEKTVSAIPYIVAGAILLLLLAGLLCFFLRKRRENGARAIPPWEHAVNAITSLLRKVRKGDARIEPSVAELSDIVRAYMEQRFSIRAEHLTSDEFFLVLNARKDLLSPGQQEFLRGFTRSADLVKFAKFSADLALLEDAARQAENLVRETIPVPEETEKKNGKGKAEK
ncbi:MAG: hypothetical protein J6331_06670 [Lentisphaeria bacterium]|nr:hypothetical protein [Lentisphaeria bacterium]